MHFMRLTLLVLGLFGSESWADTAIYGFVDSHGALFLSNIPDDDRYGRLDATLTSVAVPRAEAPSDSRTRPPYDALVANAAREYGIEAALLHAVISVESGYNARALSKRGAAGLMQLMPETARRFGVADVFDPVNNVRAGAQYLNQLLKLFDNDLPLVLAAYNAGEAAIIKYGNRIPPYPETIAYVPKVVRSYQQLRLLM